MFAPLPTAEYSNSETDQSLVDISNNLPLHPTKKSVCDSDSVKLLGPNYSIIVLSDLIKEVRNVFSISLPITGVVMIWANCPTP